MSLPGTISRWARLSLLIVAFTALLFARPAWEGTLRSLFPGQRSVVYERASLARLAGEHLILTGLSSALATLLGVTAGIIVTRKRGRDFLPVVDDITSIGQTFPPVAVLALAVPALGFGFTPTIFALFLYGLMPVLHNTVAGILEIQPEIIDAAEGLGMRPLQILFTVELPLALPVIMGGIRTSAVISVGTATIGATIGAGGLGAPIISGLISQNPAVVLHGAVPAALLAILVDKVLGEAETSMIQGR